MGYQWHDPRDEGTGKIQQVHWKVNTGQEKTQRYMKRKAPALSEHYLACLRNTGGCISEILWTKLKQQT